MVAEASSSDEFDRRFVALFEVNFDGKLKRRQLLLENCDSSIHFLAPRMRALHRRGRRLAFF